MSHVDGVRTCGFCVLNDELEMLVPLCKGECLRPDAAANINDNGAFRQAFPVEAYP